MRISDIPMASFVQIKTGIDPKIEIIGNKGIFIFPDTNETQQAMKDYLSNATIEAFRFAEATKTLKIECYRAKKR